MPLTEHQAEQREGWAYALVERLFPQQRTQHPVVFDRNVRLLFEYSLEHPHADATDPFDLRKHGTYKNVKQAETASFDWLHKPRQRNILDAMQGGFTDQAALDLGINYEHGPTLPNKLHMGKLTASRPGVWSDIWSTTKQLPGATVHDAAKVGKGAGHVAGDVFGGIGGFFKNPVVLLVVVLVLVAVIKK